ncbi:putative nucleotidyltransferase substrate binding domain-containing protein [Balneatrix alpica]|uniref:Nucleotidyltransferase substrate binding domain-containing protein n=1 Tax=Balneatrix alpica TaxID=75684 RepID=A0ABV5ZHK3_9GAMM|nr:putative nucleotidyltransferase substrate binding domain-containing protein [Balneatrix alpica]
MSATFNANKPPFNLLTPKELRLLQDNLDIAYFQQGEVIIKAGEPPEGLHIILKGRVAEQDVQNQGQSQVQHIFVHYTNDDYFGAWSSMRGHAIHNFVAVEETLCQILPTRILLELVDTNPAFADYFRNDLAVKAQLKAQNSRNQDMTEFMLAKVADSCMRDPLLVLEGTSIEEAYSLMRERKADCLLVKRGGRYGMVTGTDMLNALVVNRLSVSAEVADIASYRLITVHPDDYLFNALVLMTEHQIERVVVQDGQALGGVLELMDVLSYFSNHSHVVSLRIERAQTVEDLEEAAVGLNDLVRALVSHGVKVQFAMELIATMNEKVMAKLFNLLVPESILPHVCLLVMGSEGRREQILKTDQDNAVLMRNGLQWPERDEVLKTFSAVLSRFGYPPCPGGIMVSNPDWVLHLEDWTKRLRDWSTTATGENLMHLAIAVDAHPVAGNPALFKASRNWFLRQLSGDKIFFSHFVRAVFNFDTPLTFFGGIKRKEHGLDIKKGGIFPIVHGVRTLALEHRILETNTVKRIEQLVQMQQLSEKMGRDLIHALGLFIQLRLQQQLERTEGGHQLDETPNLLMVEQMDRMDRDLLREALHVVKEFKSHLTLRYRLEG